MTRATLFYWLDIAAGILIVVSVHVRRRPGVVPLFWLGAVVGLAWEAPIFISAVASSTPVVDFINTPPVHPFAFMVVHTFWDAGLFLAGLGVVQAVRRRPLLSRFDVQELAIFIAWGQITALGVELTSVLSGGWAYTSGHALNPELFRVAGHPITLLPQLIWLVAPVVFYGAARVYVARSAHTRATSRARGYVSRRGRKVAAPAETKAVAAAKMKRGW